MSKTLEKPKLKWSLQRVVCVSKRAHYLRRPLTFFFTRKHNRISYIHIWEKGGGICQNENRRWHRRKRKKIVRSVGDACLSKAHQFIYSPARYMDRYLHSVRVEKKRFTHLLNDFLSTYHNVRWMQSRTNRKLQSKQVMVDRAEFE